MATSFDFDFYQGTDQAVDISVVDGNEDADLEGYKAFTQLKCRCKRQTVTTLSTENGKITIDGSTIRVFFDHITTKEIPVGVYDYDVVVESASGFRSNILTGTITCKELITNVDG